MAYKPTLINTGSVDDIRCTLRYCEDKLTINELNLEVEEEMRNQCRTSVINMLNAAIKRKMKKTNAR